MAVHPETSDWFRKAVGPGQFMSCQSQWLFWRAIDTVVISARPKQAGWGKELSYVIGFGRYGATDVSRRYSTNASATRQRQNHVADPDWVQQLCQSLTRQLRSGLSQQEHLVLNERDASEQLELRQASEPADADAALPGGEVQSKDAEVSAAST